MTLDSSIPGRLRHVSKRQPCPICHKPDWCELRTDGAVHCMRVESPSPCQYRQGGWWHNLPQRRDNDPTVTPLYPVAPKNSLSSDVVPETFSGDASAPASSAETRHAVYSALLAAAPLSPAHRTHLLGLSRQIRQEALGRYGTLPGMSTQGTIIAALVRQFGRDTLLSVPGFVADDKVTGGIRLNGAGLLIPVCDTAGRIQSIQLRCDPTSTIGPRYVWLSSAAQGGPRSGAPAHVARPQGVTDRRVFVTEGALKADIATQRLQAVVVGLAGHGSWRSALPALDSLQQEGHDVLIIALDADDLANPRTVAQVEQSRHALAAAAVGMGYAVRFARWDHAQGKGLDDLLLAGNTYALEIYRPAADGNADSTDADTGDDPPPKEPLTEATALQRLRFLEREIQNPALPRAEKIVYLNAVVKAKLYPTASGEVPLVRRSVQAIARGAGVSPDRAGKALTYLDSQGLLQYAPTRSTDKLTGTPITITRIGGGRVLQWAEELPEAAHKVRDRQRAAERRCPSCQSTHLIERQLVCCDCGTICTPAEAEQAGRDITPDSHVECTDQFVSVARDGDDAMMHRYADSSRATLLSQSEAVDSTDYLCSPRWAVESTRSPDGS